MKSVRLIFSIVVLGVISVLLFNIIGEDPEVKFFPLIALVPAFVLSLIQVTKDLRILLKGEIENSANAQTEEAVFVPMEYLQSLIWMAIFLILLYLTGFLMTILLFVFGYQKYYGSSWKQSISSAAITAVLIWAVFARALNYPLYPGILFPGLYFF